MNDWVLSFVLDDVMLILQNTANLPAGRNWKLNYRYLYLLWLVPA